jgi:transcriptional regulator with XRE-family HTH domain
MSVAAVAARLTASAGLASIRPMERKPRLGSRRALIQAREKLGMTRAELAAELGVERTVIYRVEGGDRDTTVEIMRRWADALGGVSFDLFKPPSRNAPKTGEQRESAA